MHNFLGVEAIVFVEGGKVSYSLSEIDSGAYGAQADDLKYWQIIFNTFAKGKTLHFRAVGSKTTIKELALLMRSGQIRNIYVAMDRDLDHLNGTLPNGAGIFSTRGYSWENDVWNSAVVFATFKKFNTVPEAEKSAQLEIDERYKLFCKKIRHCVRVDCLLSRNGKYLLPRSEYAKVIRPERQDFPSVIMSNVKNLIRNTRIKIRPEKINRNGIESLSILDCYGHVIEIFGYHLLVHALRKFCKLRVTPRELLVPAAIDTFSQLLPTNKELVQHYSSLFALNESIQAQAPA